MLEIQHLSAGYLGNPVLNDISLNISTGAVTVLAGPNGCGKSTLLKAVAGLLPAEGSVSLRGETLLGLPARERARRIAYLPQSRSVPQITVRRLVLHGRFPYLQYPRQYSRADHAAAEAALERLGIAHLGDRSMESLSGGQRQKVYIAMALAQDTDIVLLDEPITFLDISHQLQLMELARALAESGKAVVPVLHDLTLALEHADELVLLQKGSVAARGTPEEVWQSGATAQVFGVDTGRTRVDDRWKYYYTSPLPSSRGCKL